MNNIKKKMKVDRRRMSLRKKEEEEEFDIVLNRIFHNLFTYIINLFRP